MSDRGQVPIAPVTQGRAERSLQVADFLLTEGVYRAGQTFGRHTHERAAVTIVMSGSVTESFDSRRHWCGPWSLLMKPAHEPHQNVYGAAGARCLFIEMSEAWVRRVDAPRDVMRRIWLLPAAAGGPVGRSLCHEASAPDAASPLAIEGLLLELLAACARSPDIRHSDGPPWMRRAVEHIHDAFGAPLRVADIAAHAGVHPVTLAKAFRNRHGVSPAEYLREVRLTWARDILRRSSRPIADIALSAGFWDQSHFTRLFARRFGMTPSECRRAGRASRHPDR